MKVAFLRNKYGNFYCDLEIWQFHFSDFYCLKLNSFFLRPKTRFSFHNFVCSLHPPCDKDNVCRVAHIVDIPVLCTKYGPKDFRCHIHFLCSFDFFVSAVQEWEGDQLITYWPLSCGGSWSCKGWVWKHEITWFRKKKTWSHEVLNWRASVPYSLCT